jgi:hypothetical protein
MDELGIIIVSLKEGFILEQPYAILELGFDVQVLLLHGSDHVRSLLLLRSSCSFTWWLLTHNREVGVEQRIILQLGLEVDRLGLEVDRLGPHQARIGLSLFLSVHLYITT